MTLYGLNDEQVKAITSRSPSICNASAGSGKTRCLTAKVRLLIDSGVSPKNILAITFTNKAANEMKTRIGEFCPAVKFMQVSTIHSMSVRIIKTFIQHTPLKVPFSIYDDGDQQTIIKTILKARNMTDDPYEILGMISKAKSNDTVIADEFIEDIRQVYQKILIKNNACDFDDLMIYARDCLKHDDCKEHYSNLWQYMLVDEFQDTSAIQYEIITSIFNPEKTKYLLCVGDFNQSIYSWRGAQPENINAFIKKYNPELLDLTYNYRSCSEIIAHANEFLQYGKQMVVKSDTKGSVTMTAFRDQDEEATRIADAIYKMGDYESTAILYRMNTRSLLFEKALATKRIPYKVVGAMPFYKRKVAKDLLSYCKAATNPKDLESLIRVVNVPRRGFGETKQEKLLNEGRPYLEQVAMEMPTIQEFMTLLDDIKHKRPGQAVEEIIQRTGYRSTLKDENDIAMLDYFLDIVNGFDSMEDLILTSNFLEEDSGHGVRLMSVHASKGLEFNKVFVVGVEGGIWPHKLSDNIAEEFRLYYVAISRSRSYLNISCSKSRMNRGKLEAVSPSELFIKSYNFLYKKGK